jgi:hypothetical protein
MSDITSSGFGQRMRSRKGERMEFGLLLLLAFPFFLALALISRALPMRMRLIACSPTERRPVFEEARCALNKTIPFAFMG